jgi:hypothetical protein
MRAQNVPTHPSEAKPATHRNALAAVVPIGRGAVTQSVTPPTSASPLATKPTTATVFQVLAELT